MKMVKNSNSEKLLFTKYEEVSTSINLFTLFKFLNGFLGIFMFSWEKENNKCFKFKFIFILPKHIIPALFSVIPSFHKYLCVISILSCIHILWTLSGPNIGFENWESIEEIFLIKHQFSIYFRITDTTPFE